MKNKDTEQKTITKIVLIIAIFLVTTAIFLSEINMTWMSYSLLLAYLVLGVGILTHCPTFGHKFVIVFLMMAIPSVELFFLNNRSIMDLNEFMQHFSGTGLFCRLGNFSMSMLTYLPLGLIAIRYCMIIQSSREVE